MYCVLILRVIMGIYLYYDNIFFFIVIDQQYTMYGVYLPLYFEQDKQI